MDVMTKIIVLLRKKTNKSIDEKLSIVIHLYHFPIRMFLNVFVFNYKPQVNYSIVSFEYYIVDVNKMNTAYNLRVFHTVRHEARFHPTNLISGIVIFLVVLPIL